jgi:hypothetical protein
MLIGGIVMVVAGILAAGGITWWAIWANNKLGGGIWTSVKSLPLIIAFWAGGTAMIIGGIYLASRPEEHHGRHVRGRIAEEVRHG